MWSPYKIWLLHVIPCWHKLWVAKSLQVLVSSPITTDFPLVVCSNHEPNSYRLLRKTEILVKNANIPDPLELCNASLAFKKIRAMALPDGWRRLMLCTIVSTQYQCSMEGVPETTKQNRTLHARMCWHLMKNGSSGGDGYYHHHSSSRGGSGDMLWSFDFISKVGAFSDGHITIYNVFCNASICIMYVWLKTSNKYIQLTYL